MSTFESNSKSRSEATSRGQSILIIDDETYITDLLAVYLAHAGYATATACSAEEALYLYPPLQFDAVIVDYALPGMTGVEFGALARNVNPRMGQVLLSAGNFEEEAKASGMHFLLKPANLETLIDLLGTLIARA